MAEADDLLRRAREELYHSRVVTRSLRNRLKVDAAALYDAEQRMDALIAEIEGALNGSPRPKEAQGHVERTEILSQAH